MVEEWTQKLFNIHQHDKFLFLESFEGMLDKIDNESKLRILAGDFNHDLLKSHIDYASKSGFNLLHHKISVLQSLVN